MKEKEEFLTIQEAAALLKVAPLTIWKLIRQDKLIASRVGSVWRIKRENLDKFLQEEEGQWKKKKRKERAAPALT